MTIDIAKALDANAKAKQEKTPWNNHWQLVHEFFLQRKADFTVTRQDGAFLNSDIWTALPAKAAETCASALLGLVWPDNDSFKYEPFGEDLEGNAEVKAWFEYATLQVQTDLDDPAAGLQLALDEFMLDYAVSGTPAIHMEAGAESTYRFDAWSVKQFAIDEGASGYVDTFYMEREYTVRQMYEKSQGPQGWKLSKKTMDAWTAGKFQDKVNVLHVIEPRFVDPGKGSGPQNMPWASYHIEMDTKQLLRESGYQELPTFCARASKRIGEKYGRSMAMRALPDVMELNALVEIMTLGAEKSYDPPLAIMDDGVFGGGTIDTSAGAINVMNVQGKLGAGRKPIEQLFENGSFQGSGMEFLMESLAKTINDHFMIDRLIDQDSKTQMTAQEWNGRKAMRQQALSSPLSRLKAELFDRLLERAFNMGLRAGRFGFAAGSPEAIAWAAANPGAQVRTIPQKIVDLQGRRKRVYKIRYLTPAAREQRAEEAQGIMSWLQLIGEMAGQDPTVGDTVNAERTLSVMGDIWNVPQECKNTPQELQQIRAVKADAQMQQSKLDQTAQGATIAKTLAQASQASAAAVPQAL